MNFQASTQNVTSLLVIALGVVAGYCLSKKRFESNLTIFFYLVVLAYSNWTDRQVNSWLYAAGLVMALLLRFEFMNIALTKFVLALELLAVAAISLTYLGHVFN